MSQPTEMLFKVRDPFVVSRVRYVEVPGIKKPERQVHQFWPRQTVLLKPDEVKLHAHQIEPTDERSAAALEALHFVPRPPEEPPLDPRLLALFDAFEARLISALAGRKAAKS